MKQKRPTGPPKNICKIPKNAPEPTNSDITNTFRALSSAKFDEACRISSALKQKYPNSRTAEWLDIVMIADRAEYTLTGRKRTAEIAPCIRHLRALSKRLKGVEPRLRSRVLNELYYFTKAFRKQMRLGRLNIKQGDKSGHYSIGVGATWQALSLLEDAHLSRAKYYAKIGKASLEQFIKRDPTYSNTYLQLSLALEILGCPTDSNLAFDQGVRKLKGDTAKIRKFFESHRKRARIRVGILNPNLK